MARIARVSLVVNDYDEAINFYTTKLDFIVIEDIPIGEGKRWVVISPSSNSTGCELVLGKADNEEQKKSVGFQAGGRVFLFLKTDNFERDYNKMKERGIEFTEEPRYEPYGTVVIFKDLYGNMWDLIQNK